MKLFDMNDMFFVQVSICDKKKRGSLSKTIVPRPCAACRPTFGTGIYSSKGQI